jgi:hypothetical protein
MLAYQQRIDPSAAMWHAGYVMGWITAAQGLPRVQHLCKPRRLAKGHPGNLILNR